MLSKRKSFISVSLIVLVLIIAASAVNIFYKVENHRLEADIEQFTEEKENLRAKYLSEISMAKLNSRADRMQMHEANLSSYKISAKLARGKYKELSSKLKQQNSKKSQTLISGY